MAAASCVRGGVVVLLLLLLVHLRVSAVGTGSGEDSSVAGGAPALIHRQEAQLLRLESLVDSLSRAVSRLESAVSVNPAPPASAAGTTPSSPPAVATPTGGGGEAARQPSPVMVTKFKLPWSERFQFVAAAQLESEPTCATALPYADQDGVSKYFAVGDARGRALVFSSGGDVLVELPAPPSAAPVTAILAFFSFRRNESRLLTGHGDGSVVAHRLWESAASNDEWPTLVLGGSWSFFQEGDQAAPAITGLEAQQMGRFKYVVATDGGGRIRVFRENGTLYGTAVSSGRPLAFAKQRLLFLTGAGAGSLDLPSVAVRETSCEGLDGASAESYAFDVSDRSKAYGFSAAGHLIHVQLLGDTVNLKCRVRAMRKTEIQRPVAVHAIKGYLLAVNREKVFVYNVSSQYYGRAGPPRLLFSAALEEIRSVFMNSHNKGSAIPTDGIAPAGNPLIAGDREKLIIMGLGGRFIGIYRSNFPVHRAASSAVLWSSPALIFLLFLILVWYFYVKKKDVLGWTPDEAFHASMDSSSGMNGATASDRDRAFADGSRAGDHHRDIRGSVLRGPPRRYISPPRYAAGGASSAFRPGSSSDSAFMGAGELKYRGQGVEPPGFPKRRESIFANTQVVDDHVE